jgi:LmbE family N-acetylglucosaminyl deacetylase
VIGLGDHTPLASPDHYQASLITEAAVFYTKLTKWEEHFPGVPPCPQPAMMYCHLAFRTLSPLVSGGIVVDISETLDTKLAAIGCYRTQFPPEKLRYLDLFRAFAVQQGMAAGFAAGEPLSSPTVLGVRDLMGLLRIGPAEAMKPRAEV